jgi:hypothetical protein
LIGLGIGASLGTAWCIGAIADNSGDVNARVECGRAKLALVPAISARTQSLRVVFAF